MQAKRDVSVSFAKVGQGWANCTLRVGQREFTLGWISDTTDALGDLVRAALHIRVGGFEAQARFDREPGELRLILHHRWEGTPQRRIFRLRVLEFPDISADTPEASGQERFCVECDPDTFARAVEAAAAAVLKDVGSKGHTNWWGVPFPARAYKALVAALED